MARTLSPLFTWRSAVSSPYGPDSPTRRHILLTLSLHMNEKGGSCYPSQTRLAKETGLDQRTIERHLADVEDEWLDIERRNGRNNLYTPTIPPSFWTALDDGLDAGETLAHELVQSVPERFGRPEEEEESTHDTPGTVPGVEGSSGGEPPAENRGSESDTPGREPGEPRHSVGESPGTVPDKDDRKDVNKDDNHHPPAQVREAGGEGGGGGSGNEKNTSGRDQRVAALVEEGVSERNAKQLVSEHSWTRIYLQLLHYRYKQERGGSHAPDGPGWIVAAVEEGYDLPPAVRRQASQQRAESDADEHDPGERRPGDGSSTEGDPHRSAPSVPEGGSDGEGPAPPPGEDAEPGGDSPPEGTDQPGPEDVPDEPPDLDLDEICGTTPGTTRLSPDFRSTHRPND